MNILFLTGQLNYVDGVTNHLYYLLKGILNFKDTKIFLITGGGDAVKKFQDIGIHVDVNSKFMHRNRSIKNFSECIVKIIQFINKNNIQIIHSHNHYAANIAARAGRFTNTTTIQTNHGLLNENGHLPHFKAQKFIAVNEHIKDHMLKNKSGDLQNIILIRHGIPSDVRYKKEPKDEINILSAARLVPEKGLDLFIKAAADIKNNFKRKDYKLNFSIAGAGPSESELVDMNDELHAGIKFLGVVTDMTSLLQTNDIFIMPTRSTSEGFPMSLVEASFANNLIITSSFLGLDPVFINEVDGLTFNVNDHCDLAAKIIYAIENPSQMDRMKNNFFNKATSIFDLKTMITKHLQLYEKCLD